MQTYEHITINRLNCFGFSIEDTLVTYSRMIDNYVFKVSKDSDNVLSTLKILSELSDDNFKYLARLQKSVETSEVLND